MGWVLAGRSGIKVCCLTVAAVGMGTGGRPGPSSLSGGGGVDPTVGSAMLQVDSEEMEMIVPTPTAQGNGDDLLSKSALGDGGFSSKGVSQI